VQLRGVTVLVAGATEVVSAALPDDRRMRRVGTLAEARSVLPEVDLVAVGDGFEPGADTLLGMVRLGVHCPSDTPVVRLVDGPRDVAGLDDPPRRQSDFDAVVPAGDREAVRSALTLGERTEQYRDAVADLYEACRARAEGGADADVDDAFERATRAFEEVREAAGRTPYEQLLGGTGGEFDPSEREPVPDSNPEESEVTGDRAG